MLLALAYLSTRTSLHNTYFKSIISRLKECLNSFTSMDINFTSWDSILTPNCEFSRWASSSSAKISPLESFEIGIIVFSLPPKELVILIVLNSVHSPSWIKYILLGKEFSLTRMRPYIAVSPNDHTLFCFSSTRQSSRKALSIVEAM